MHLTSTTTFCFAFILCSMVILLFVTSFLLVCDRGVTTIDVMRYDSVRYSLRYQEFLHSSNTFYPWYGYPLEKEWKTTTATTRWTPEFFAGVLWNLIEYNATREVLKCAVHVTAPIVSFAKYTGGVDIGFVIMSSFGN